ncbi:MAG: carboxypeptidase regulatory-like domain-containing protein, partial [Bryobacter sp.]|nr:carboxypeptidase regulatory-like domain-containing protein [Bryobacter sp.]
MRILVGFMLSVALLLAQSGTGTIQGVVQDASGAVVPGAKIELTHLATTRVYQVESNAAGLFTQPGLTIGDYTARVLAAGFKPWEGKLTLLAGQVAQLRVEVVIGSSATEITVAGDVTNLVVTESATLGQITERSRIEQLPLNGRLLTSLVGVTTPGLDGDRVFGLRETAFEYMQDGAVLKNRDTGGHTGRPPGLDTVQEFKVETNNSSARFNRPASVQVVTRSGTNEWHGSLFETARNNGIGVARRRQDFYDKPPQLIRNEFGGSFGGPVILPKFYNGRNRTFFFGSWEGYRLRQSSTFSTTMPTAQMREGDFSGLVDSLGRPTTLYDPWTTDAQWRRTPYPGNRIPTNKRSPVAAYLYSVTPLPTFTDRNPLVTANYFGVAPNNRDDNTLTLRFDHKVTDRDQVFFRYTRGDSWRTYRSSSSTSAPTTDGSTNITNTGSDMQNGALSWTRTWSPTFFGETLLTASSEIFDVSTGIYDVNYASNLKLPNPFNEVGFPYISGTGFNQQYTQIDTRRNNRTLLITIDENLTKIAGKHELQFGGRFRNERMHVLPDQQYVSGNHSFSSGATGLYDPTSGSAFSAVPRTGHDSANLFLGVAGSYAAQFVQRWYRFREREYAFYLQDNWKVNSRLTLNLGLRWEIHPSFHEMNNLFTGFDRASRQVVNGQPLEELYKLGSTTPEIVSNFTRIGVKFT